MEALLGILLLFSAVLAVTGNMHNDPIYHCSQKEPQQSLLLNQIMGIWYVVESVHHRHDTNVPKGISTRDFCPTVNIQEDLNGGLTLLYEEPNFSTKFSLSILDRDNQPGVWTTKGAQNVTMTSSMKYSHFAGTIEVIKAVGNHMVLTYCSPGTELYTEVLSRRKELDRGELNSVNSLLARKRLHSVAVYEFCKGAASGVIPSATFILFSIIFLSFKINNAL